MVVVFDVMVKAAGLPAPVREFCFHPVRKWRFDYAWPDFLIAVEIEGGVWSRGRHTRGAGYVKDMEKYNEAARLHWRAFRFTPQQIKNGKAITYMEAVFSENTKKGVD